MDPQQLVQFIVEGKWWAVAALVIGLVIRLLKSDVKIPINIPAPYRVWIALGLGIVAGACNKVASGMTWRAALLWGLGAAIAAIVGHETLVESLRRGKELPVPGLMVKPVDPPSEKKEEV